MSVSLSVARTRGPQERLQLWNLSTAEVSKWSPQAQLSLLLLCGVPQLPGLLPPVLSYQPQHLLKDLGKIWVTCIRSSNYDKTVMESQPGERVETWTKSLQPPYVRVKLLEAGAPLTGGLQSRVKAVEELGSLTVLCVAGGSHCLRLASLSMALSSIQSGCYYSPPSSSI